MTGSMRRWHRSSIIRTSSPSHNPMYVLHDFLANHCLSLLLSSNIQRIGCPVCCAEDDSNICMQGQSGLGGACQNLNIGLLMFMCVAGAE